MALQGPTVQELREDYEARKAQLLVSLFDMSTKASEIDLPIEAGVARNLTDTDLRKLHAKLGAEWAVEQRDKVKSQWLDLETEQGEAVSMRAEAVLDYLAPKNVSVSDLMVASNATEEQLINMADVAEEAGHEDAVKLAFQVVRQKDYDLAEQHILEMKKGDGWDDLYAELAEAAEFTPLDYDELESRFEVLARAAPKAEEIMNSTPKSRINVSGAIKS